MRVNQPAVVIEFSPGNGRGQNGRGFVLAGFADEQLEVLFETAERFRVALGVFFLFVVVAEFNDENDRQNFDTARSAFILGPCAPFPYNWEIAVTRSKLHRV